MEVVSLENKHICFGYGKIGVHNKDGLLWLSLLDEAQEAGSSASEKKSTPIVEFYCDVDMYVLLRDLNAVKYGKLFVIFRDWTFDFSNYNENSLGVMITHVSEVLDKCKRLLAC